MMNAAIENHALPLAGVSLSMGQTLWIVLWIGLAALSLSLVILMWTRWGQAKPLSKCIALSVFAHVLLVGYAYSTKLFFDPPPPDSSGQDVVRLALQPDHQDDPQQEETPQAPQPWERLAEPTNIPPEAAPPARSETPDAALTEPAATDAPDLDGADNFAQVRPYDPQRPLPALPVAVPRQDAAAPVKAKIEAPPVAKRVDVKPTTPQTAQLPPLAIPSLPPLDSKPQLASNLPRGLLDTAPPQQVADALKTDQADAAAGDRDKLDPSANRDNNTAQQLASSSPTAGQKQTPETGATGNPNVANAAAAPAAAPRRLGDGKPVPPVYRRRMQPNRLELIRRFGGNAETEAAVDAALRWLASVQRDDGRWDASDHGGGQATRALGEVLERPGAQADTGITGLALLAFLARGHSHLEGQYRENVQHGLEFLLASQHKNGSLAGNAKTYASMYCHGMASLALSEAYAVSGDQRLKPYVERAVQYTVAAQHPGSGGWRYQPGDEGDMSQFGWQVMALASARQAGIETPARTRLGMLKFMQSVSSGRYGGLASYRRGEQATRAMTAEALTCRFFLETDRQPETLREASAFIAGQLPTAGKANLYYWYYATIALHQTQDQNWPAWSRALQRELLTRQQSQGKLSGSWDPDTQWGNYGGRVYSTALATLCLEVYYRYLPMYDR